MLECVVQRVGARANGRAVLAILGKGQKAVARLRARWSQRERTHPLSAFWLDQLPHLQSDPVATPTEERQDRETIRNKRRK